MVLQRESHKNVLDDKDIVELYWQRDEAAISETDKKYKKYLFTVAYNIVHDTPDCEECLNDTYIGAWNSIPPSRPSVLRAFLTTIMRRIAINRYHSKIKKSAIPSEMTVSLSELEDFIDDGSSAEEKLDTYIISKIISGYLRSLSERNRYIFMSRYYLANTVNKIASDLNLSCSTVNKELAFIRKGLKEKLESEGISI
ncbi:MAG: sigma-70 family RNA polymerase sigma factor [Ruminococcaceae bacterium]|nr:sigma-70 family RNA polymerase sigma factor [Oscillospiraceae bacterium]